MKPDDFRAQFFESFRKSDNIRKKDNIGKKDHTDWIDPEATLYSESSIS